MDRSFPTEAPVLFFAPAAGVPFARYPSLARRVGSPSATLGGWFKSVAVHMAPEGGLCAQWVVLDLAERERLGFGAQFVRHSHDAGPKP